MGLNKNQNGGNFNGEVGDMSNYATKSDLSTKVTKETNKSLVDDALIDKLEGLENYDDSLVKEEINGINSQLEQNTNYIKARKRDNIYRLNELGCIPGAFKSIKEVFPNVTVEEVQLLDSTATLENSHVWYIIQKIMNDNIDTPATVIIDNLYYVDKTIQLTKSKTIIGESNQQDLFNSSNNSVLYKIGSGDLFTVEKYSANNLYMSDFGAVGEKKDETAGDFLSIKRSLSGFTLKRLNVRIFKNGIRKYSGHTICGLIDNCKFAYFADNGIHLSHLGNDSQVNQVTISNCAVHQFNTQNVFNHINSREQIINEDYGNCICISGSGNIIDNVFIEDGICGINLTGQYKKGITVKGVYSEMSNIADIYVPNTEYINNQIALNAFKVIGSNYTSKGIFIGDKKVENYEPKTVEQLEDGYYPENNRLLVKNNFTEIKIKFKSTYNLSDSELIRTHFYRTFNEISRITATYNGIFKLVESFMPNDSGELGVDYNTIFFSGCDIKSVSVDETNKLVTLYFYDSIKLNEFINLGQFRAQTDFINGDRFSIFTVDFTQINVDDNSITIPYTYASTVAQCQEGNDISGYLYTWKNPGSNMYSSNVTIANGLVKKYEGVNEYVYEINVNKEINNGRLRSHPNYIPDFYSFEFPNGMTISNIAIYKK